MKGVNKMKMDLRNKKIQQDIKKQNEINMEYLGKKYCEKCGYCIEKCFLYEYAQKLRG